MSTANRTVRYFWDYDNVIVLHPFINLFIEKLQPKLGKGHFDIYADKTRYKVETDLPNVTVHDSLKCAVKDCWELATKESVFDNKHKCTSTIVDCQAAALNLGGVCRKHKCAVIGCWYGAQIVDGLCVKHKRRPDGTWDGVEPLGRVCKKHECAVDGCWYAARTLGGICDKYICGARDCSRMAQTFVWVCNEHKCARDGCWNLPTDPGLYCHKPNCAEQKEHQNYIAKNLRGICDKYICGAKDCSRTAQTYVWACIEHTCARDGCWNLSIVPSQYCNKANCTEQKEYKNYALLMHAKQNDPLNANESKNFTVLNTDFAKEYYSRDNDELLINAIKKISWKKNDKIVLIIYGDHDYMTVLPALKQMGVAIAVVFRCNREELNGRLQQIADKTYTLYDIVN
uniref:NYN domain-containing protein n=1 Tax=Plectus sambesii TaxID=2011161 RepID=A0A914X7E4_9BILA